MHGLLHIALLRWLSLLQQHTFIYFQSMVGTSYKQLMTTLFGIMIAISCMQIEHVHYLFSYLKDNIFLDRTLFWPLEHSIVVIFTVIGISPLFWVPSQLISTILSLGSLFLIQATNITNCQMQMFSMPLLPLAHHTLLGVSVASTIALTHIFKLDMVLPGSISRGSFERHYLSFRSHISSKTCYFLII